jgi:hypothetical protein
MIANDKHQTSKEATQRMQWKNNITTANYTANENETNNNNNEHMNDQLTTTHASHIVADF